MSNEPIVIINAVVTIVTFIVVYLFNSSGVILDTEQLKLIDGILGSLGLLVATFLSRSKVVPVAKLNNENRID